MLWNGNDVKIKWHFLKYFQVNFRHVSKGDIVASPSIISYVVPSDWYHKNRRNHVLFRQTWQQLFSDTHQLPDWLSYVIKGTPMWHYVLDIPQSYLRAVHKFLAPSRSTWAQFVWEDEGRGRLMSHTSLMLWLVSFQEITASGGHLFGLCVDSDLVNNYCIIFWLNRAWNECLYPLVNIDLW